MNSTRVGALGLLLMTTVVGASDAPSRGATVSSEKPALAEEPEGLRFRLNEGADTVEGPLHIARPTASHLDAADTQLVLDRMPPWKQTGELREQPFALREGSLPPPRTGETVLTAFPPPQAPERAPGEEAGPVEVLRHAPEGEAALAPHLSVTLSAPMVAVSSHEALARETPPVRLSPQPPGEWRWVGTRTLLFEPEGRFPMATEYRASKSGAAHARRAAPRSRAASRGASPRLPRGSSPSTPRAVRSRSTRSSSPPSIRRSTGRRCWPPFACARRTAMSR